MSKVMLKYWFVFDPKDTGWDTVGRFAEFISKALANVNMDAEMINSPDGNDMETKIYISPRPQGPPIPGQTKGKPGKFKPVQVKEKGPQDALKAMQRQFKKQQDKFKRNG